MKKNDYTLFQTAHYEKENCTLYMAKVLLVFNFIICYKCYFLLQPQVMWLGYGFNQHSIRSQKCCV